MGCATSKKQNREDDVVFFCKERKSLIKLALERRYALAEAQCKYNQSLYALALAIRLFVARHSLPSSPFLITFPSTNSDTTPTLLNNPVFLQHKPSEPACEIVEGRSLDWRETQKQGNPEGKESNNRTNCKEEDDDGEFSEEEEPLCAHFYGDVGAPLLSPRRDYGWDFFNLFDVASTQVESGLTQNTNEDLRVVREREGIPELEEDCERVARGKKVVNVKKDDVGHVVGEIKATRTGHDTKLEQCGGKNLSESNRSINGRELLEALKDVEDHFIRVYNSGKVVSRMLEANRTPLQSCLDDIKESSKKLIRSITWNRSNSLQSSSGKSLLTSISHSSSTWTELSNDLYDDCGGMGSGSHLLTLERLYAWEKKLYEEVKAGEEIRKIFDRKCSRFRNQEVREDSLHYGDKSTAEVVELYTRILVAVRSAESISKRIQKLKDEVLLPQLVELLNSLLRNWKITLESHETQYQILNQVRFFNCAAYGNFSNGSHRLATIQLEAELQNWRTCFASFVSAEKAYIEALHGWLSKFTGTEVEFYSWGRYSIPPYKINKPPLLVISHDWLACLKKLPDKVVANAIKSFSKDIQALWVQQGKELQQKRKVDGLAKEIDSRVIAFQRVESRILGSEHSEKEAEVNVRSRIQYLSKRKDLLDIIRKRLDEEKEKHQTNMKETQHVTLNAFQCGLCSVFESLVEFSKASIQMYATLVTYRENGSQLLQ